MDNKIGIDFGEEKSRISFLENGQIKTIEIQSSITIENEKIYGTKRLLSSPEDLKSSHGQTEGQKLYAHYIAAQILKELTLKTKKEINETDLTITAPSCFTTLQMEALKKACEKAGFKKINFCPETIAAAIYYGFNKEKKENILVCDWGHGKFDSSLISVDDNTFKILSSCGDNFLGGKDIDNLIVEKILSAKLIQKYSLEAFNRSNPKYVSQFKELELLAKNVKEILTNEVLANIEIDILIGEKQIKENIKITQDDLEKITLPMIQNASELLKQTVSESKISFRAINKIILCGGVTKLPFIKKKLFEQFFVSIDNSLDENAISKGALLYANKYENRIVAKDFKIPYSVAFALVQKDRRRTGTFIKREIIFEKNSIYPQEFTMMMPAVAESLKDSNQNVLPAVTVFEGENVVAEHNIFVCNIGLSGKDFDYDLFKGYEFEITVRLDEWRNLSVEARIPIIDKQGNIRKSTLDKKINLQNLIYALQENKTSINRISQFLTENEKENIQAKIKTVKNTLRNAVLDIDEKRKANSQILKLFIDIDDLQTAQFRPIFNKINKLEKSVNDVLVQNFSSIINEITDMLLKFSKSNTLPRAVSDETFDCIAIQLKNISVHLSNKRLRFKESRELIDLAHKIAKSSQIKNICYKELVTIEKNIKNYNPVKYFLNSEFGKKFILFLKKIAITVVVIILIIIILKTMAQ